jgi:hypothetical protein
MRRLMVTMVLAVVLAARVAAQEPAEPNPERAARLRQMIEARFAARAQEELGLNDEQFQRLRSTSAQFAAQRRGVEEQERRLRQAMAFQLRPGIAADQDSVAKLTDALINVKGAYVQAYRDEMKALSAFLTPVQRAQYFVLRERLLNLAQQVRTQRALRADSGPAGPGALRPRRRP